MIQKLLKGGIAVSHTLDRRFGRGGSIASLLARQLILRMRADYLEKRSDGLLACGFKAYSQHDEDGIIQEIFRRIGTTNKVFVEFGCGSGLENDTLYLLLSGWSGVWMDGSQGNLESLRSLHNAALKRGSLKAEQCMVTAENVDETLFRLCATKTIDLLSIDIDGNDYWVWKAIESVTPRVVVVEYNATFRPPVRVVQEYRPDACWNGTNFYGASLKALEQLASSKGYELVGCNLAGQAAFFVHRDCIKGNFSPPFTAEHHYMPANFDLFPLVKGHDHPPGVGSYVLLDAEHAPVGVSNAR